LDLRLRPTIVAKPDSIEFSDGTVIPILYEDRAVMAIDKPAFWMLIPYSWQRTNRNLQAAIVSSIAENHYWARSRGLRFLRYIHRLDAETTGILLFGKSRGAVDAYGRLFESRRMKKVYLVVVRGVPKQSEWTCHAKLGTDPSRIGLMKVDARQGKDAETHFRLLQSQTGPAGKTFSVLEAHPLTGRTHQIRLHCVDSGCPVVGDDLYGADDSRAASGKHRLEFPMGLRAVSLAYEDPFNRKSVTITASGDRFLAAFGFTRPGIVPAEQSRAKTSR
jgi:23S rRNA pseudouridine1911/1915/1917 synthase